MFSLFGRFFTSIISNSFAIIVADYLITGFIFEGNFINLLVLAFLLTVINTFIRPIFKLFLGPLIVLTLGLFIIVINSLMLYLLDLLADTLTIQGYMPLLIATMVFGIINTAVNMFGKMAHKE